MNVKISVLLTVWMSIAYTFGFAQGPGVINGKVQDKHKKAVDGASVVLIQNGLSLASALSQADGSFVFKGLKTGNYTFAVSAVGFKIYKSTLVELSDGQSSVQLAPVMLESTDVTLKEVNVTAQKSFVENKIDRTVVNVGSMISNTGSNALEVLEKAPGVSVDENGNISFKGKNGVMVLIDDKPTYLSAADLAAYLRALPSGTLDKIELMENPPSKYDAAGNGGVINIKTKKSQMSGSNGSLSASYRLAKYQQTSESFNWNYRTPKVNFFANAAYSYNDPYRKLGIERAYFKADGSLNSVFSQETYFRNKNHNGNLKLGLDYYLSPKTTWGVVLTGLLSPGRSDANGNTMLLNGSRMLDSTLVSVNSSKNKFSKGGLGLNYTHQFDSTGKSISFDFDYIHYASRADESFQSNSYYPSGDPRGFQLISDRLPSDIDIYAFKSDYVLPFKDKSKLETGIKTSYISTDNAASYFDQTDGGNIPINDKTNHFLYKENINAAYVSFSRSFRRFDIKAGLRLENTNGFGHQLGNVSRPDSAFTKHYTNLFPTAYLSYKLDTAGHHVLIISYGRRIDRPNYRSLNPFIFLVDKYTYFAGDPYIRPQFLNNYKLAYSYKSVLTTAISYNYITDALNERIEQKGDIFISRTGNMGTETNYGVSVNLALKPLKFWTLNAYTEVIRNSVEGLLYGRYFTASSTYWSFNSSQQFMLPDGWSAELSGFYFGRRASGQFVNDSRWQLNSGIQKKILQNKASLKLSVRDIFNSYISKGTINGIPGAQAFYKNNFDSQSLTLGFTYNFGQALSSAKKRDTGSSEAEQGRVK